MIWGCKSIIELTTKLVKKKNDKNGGIAGVIIKPEGETKTKTIINDY